MHKKGGTERGGVIAPKERNINEHLNAQERGHREGWGFKRTKNGRAKQKRTKNERTKNERARKQAYFSVYQVIHTWCE